MKDSQFFAELMLRAPSVPEWYKPKFPEPCPGGDSFDVVNGIVENGELKGKIYEEADHLLRRWAERKMAYPMLSWPSFYAQSVLDAMPKEEEKRLIIPIDNPKAGDAILCAWDGNCWNYKPVQI